MTGKPKIYLHIGPMKSGTSFIQKTLRANEENLANAGYLLPGQNTQSLALASRDILGRRGDPEFVAAGEGMWDRCAHEMLAHDGDASIFSMEFLSTASSDDAQRIIESLSGAEVHVVITARDASRVIPGQWQTTVRSGGTLAWPDYARALTATMEGANDRTARAFQRQQNVRKMLASWCAVIPAERIHVVTVPPSGAPPLLLWERFAEAVGINPEVVQNQTFENNESLGAASAELLRRVNERIDRPSQLDYIPTVRQYLARKVLSPRSPEEARIVNHQRLQRFAATWNRRTRSGIEESGAHLVGDLGDLPSQPPSVDSAAPRKPTIPPPAELLAAAAPAVDGMWRLVDRYQKRLARLGVDGTAMGALPDRPEQGCSPSRWKTEPKPLAGAAAEVSSLVQGCMNMHARLRREGG